MTATIQTETNAYHKSTTQIQRLAWVIVLVSFALFCSISIALTGGVYFFFFRSTVPMSVDVQVGRGSAGIVAASEQLFPRSGSLSTPLSDRPVTLSTDTLSQATITFEAASEIDNIPIVIGTLTLKNGSFITLENARQPRFAWSDGAYIIEFDDFIGQAELFITATLDRPLSLQIKTAQGNATYVFDTIGRYSIIADQSFVRVTTYEGRALLVSPDNRNSRFAITGERATLLTGTNLPVVTSAPIDLLENGRFAFAITTNEETAQLQMPQQWGCFNYSENVPSGQWRADTWQGRFSVRLIRETGSTTSRTGCSFLVEALVTDYTYLELEATISLNFQNLVNCGIVGSECPMMIFVDYVDTQGIERNWYQSFFYEYDPQNPAPLVCQTCAQAYEHRQIAKEVWYTFESGNLISRLPEDQRPAIISEVRFYASGHQYDVFLSEIALFAGTEQVDVPSDRIPNNDND